MFFGLFFASEMQLVTFVESEMQPIHYKRDAREICVYYSFLKRDTFFLYVFLVSSTSATQESQHAATKRTAEDESIGKYLLILNTHIIVIVI